MPDNQVYLTCDQATKLIPNFDGNKKDFPHFINCIEIVQRRSNPENMPLLLDVVKTKLTGSAYNAIRYRSIESWDALKSQLKQNFSEKRTIPHLEAQLASLRQKPNESVAEYTSKLDSIIEPLISASCEGKTDAAVVVIEELLKKRALHSFILGLKQPIKLLVESRNFEEYELAVEGAIQKEREILLEKESFKFVQNFDRKIVQHPQHRNSYQVNNRNSNFNHNYREQPNSFRRESTFSSNNNRVNFSTLICAYCKNKGHHIRDCRKRQYVNSTQSNSNSNRNPNFNNRISGNNRSAQQSGNFSAEASSSPMTSARTFK
ncbi:uncharacterized protein LOC108736557 [Agrilus planipennis]|uniref:Uncharacterized protein LOC108736557 n=1 Tax=Agrilus planipennis TaxID=224129 RepID=A0A1W4WKT8_AGRPL|nr:uncharacterized protein LOC108736557 [Agrilus planipennis]